MTEDQHQIDTAQPFLIFSERGGRYALPAAIVREALRLPRLTALEETAPWVLGAFELRGELVPLVSPSLCLHHPPIPTARLSDLAVVADRDGHPLAFYANEITTLAIPRRVLPIPADSADDGNIIAYEIALEDGIARVLDPARVRLHATDTTEVSDLPDQRLSAFEQALDASAIERFAARATRYSLIPSMSTTHGQESFALLGIGGASLAMAASDCLELVRIGPLVPAPCTPAHILGLCALRGEVVPLVDVRSALGLPAHGLWEPPMMAVIRFDGQRTGIAVDAAFSVALTRLEPATELPLALRTAGEHWLRGAIRVKADGKQPNAGQINGRPLPVVDVGALLESGRLVVDGPE